jgi:Ca2+-binding RTX toxin-like protein
MPVFTGTVAANTIAGTADDDLINGLQGNDILSGLDGNDVLNGDDNDDTLTGGAGNDTLNGGVGNDTASYSTATAGVTVSLLLQGAAQDTLGAGLDTLNSIERLIGSAYDDVLTGDAGNNIFTGGAGNDSLNGGEGADQFTAGLGNDTIDGGDGNDAVNYADATGDVIVDLNIQGVAQDTGGGGVDTLIGIESVFGGAFNDTLTGNSGNNSLSGGSAGNDILNGGDGNDSLSGLTGDDVMNGGDGVDTANYAGTATAVTVSLLLQGAAQDTLGAGLDTLSGIENLTGSRFNDILTGDAGDNVIEGGVGNDTIDGGDGNDSFLLGASAVAGGWVNLDEGFTGSFAAQASQGTGVDSLVNIENATGTNFRDELAGSDLANRLLGLGGDDTIHGSGGDDHIEGGLGGDILYGGAGDDVLYAETAAAAAAAEYSFNQMEGGAGDDLIFGAMFDDVLEGDDGDDILDGGLGNNTYWGGDGIDTVSYASAIGGVNVVLVFSNNEVDTGGGTYSQFSLIENLSGSSFGDSLTGDGLANRLSGQAGADDLDGAAGDDVLVGGEGDDQIDGGIGADSVVLTGLATDYDITIDGDTVTLVDTRAGAGDGTDVVTGVEQFVFSDRTLSLEQLIPQPLDLADDHLTVTRGLASDLLATALLANDVVNFDSAVQSVSNAVGATVSLVGGRLVILATGETASFDYTVDGPSGPVTAHVSVDTTPATTAADTLAPSPTATGADLQGGNEADSLTGSDGDDRLAGGAGDDVLSGGLGRNELIGGTGLDTYLVTGGADTIVELANGSTDTVQANVDYTLPDNVENLILIGGALNGAGNALVNRLTGNDSDNVLDGGAGVDFLNGGLGNDTYVVDNLSDKITETGGVDTIRTSLLSFTLKVGLENLTYTGSGGFSGKGNAAANILTGGDGDDRLESVGGNDTLIGGIGDDSYYVASNTDVIVEGEDLEGGDFIYSKAHYVLAEGVGVENLRVWGTGAVNLTGNSDRQSLVGNDNRNVLDGGGGTDLMWGMGGDDTYILRSAPVFSNMIQEDVGAGYDTVMLHISGWTLVANFEKAVLVGTATAVTGNALNNLLVGNALGNFLSGGAGADVMQGGAGNDTYVVDDTGDVVQDTSGIDTVRLVAALNYTLGTGIENVGGTDNSALALTVTGNSLANVMTGEFGNDTFAGLSGNDTLVGDQGADSLDGGDGNDSLSGGAGADVLLGGAGADLLDGGAAADSMTGGLGNDIYVVDDAADVIVEAAGGGTDIVRTALLDYTLAAEVETFQYLGGDGFIAFGNSLANTMTVADNPLDASGTMFGMEGNDTLIGGDRTQQLDGGAGFDRLIGGGGADDLWGGGTEKDLFVYTGLADSNASSGIDQIQDFDSADVIDLRAIDADIHTDGDQAFTYIGGAGFSGVAGQLRLSAGADHMRILADVNGDGAADFELVVTGIHNIIKADFLL